MEYLKEVTKKKNTNLDPSSSSHEHGIFSFSFSFNEIFTSYSTEWIIDSRVSYHMANHKTIYFSISACITKQVFDGIDRSLGVVGSGTNEI